MMFESKYLLLAFVCLCFHSITAKSLCTSNNGSCKNEMTFTIDELVKDISGSFIKAEHSVNKLRTSTDDDDLQDLQDVFILISTEISGLEDCIVENDATSYENTTIEFDIYCPHVQAIYKSKDCTVKANPEKNKCTFCYNDYVFKIKTDLIMVTVDSMEYFKTSNNSFLFVKRNDSPDLCPDQNANELTPELAEFSEMLRNVIFKAYSSKIMKNIDNQLMYADIETLLKE